MNDPEINILNNVMPVSGFITCDGVDEIIG